MRDSIKNTQPRRLQLLVAVNGQVYRPGAITESVNDLTGERAVIVQASTDRDL